MASRQAAVENDDDIVEEEEKEQGRQRNFDFPCLKSTISGSQVGQKLPAPKVKLSDCQGSHSSPG